MKNKNLVIQIFLIGFICFSQKIQSQALGTSVILSKSNVSFENKYGTFYFKKDGNQKYIANEKGDIIVDKGYQEVSISSEYIIVTKDFKTGVIDYEKNILIPFNYHKIYFDNNFIILEKNKKVGISSLDGKEIIPVQFDEVHFEEGYIIVKSVESFGLYDDQGKLILPTVYDMMKIKNWIRRNKVD